MNLSVPFKLFYKPSEAIETITIAKETRPLLFSSTIFFLISLVFYIGRIYTKQTDNIFVSLGIFIGFLVTFFVITFSIQSASKLFKVKLSTKQIIDLMGYTSIFLIPLFLVTMLPIVSLSVTIKGVQIALWIIYMIGLLAFGVFWFVVVTKGVMKYTSLNEGRAFLVVALGLLIGIIIAIIMGSLVGLAMTIIKKVILPI